MMSSKMTGIQILRGETRFILLSVPCVCVNSRRYVHHLSTFIRVIYIFLNLMIMQISSVFKAGNEMTISANKSALIKDFVEKFVLFLKS